MLYVTFHDAFSSRTMFSVSFSPLRYIHHVEPHQHDQDLPGGQAIPIAKPGHTLLVRNASPIYSLFFFAYVASMAAFIFYKSCDVHLEPLVSRRSLPGLFCQAFFGQRFLRMRNSTSPNLHFFFPMLCSFQEPVQRVGALPQGHQRGRRRVQGRAPNGSLHLPGRLGEFNTPPAHSLYQLAFKKKLLEL